MLIEFSVENFKCFAEKQTLDMRPDPDITSLDENLIRTGLVDEAGDELVLLPSVAIYGANASGKSSLLEAIDISIPINREGSYRTFFDKKQATVFNSTLVVITQDSNFKISNFKIREKTSSTEANETMFGIKDDYQNLKSLKNIDLSYEEGFNSFAGFSNEHPKEELCTRGVYFLNEIVQYSEKHIDQTTGLFKVKNRHYFPLIQTLEDDKKRKKLEALIEKADFNLKSIKLEPLEALGDGFYTISFTLKDETKKLRYNDQSQGTKQFLLIMPTIVHVLETGAVLLADELEAHLHPDLCRAIIELFNNPETNPKGSQLIFTTHNQDFMAPNLMRPDQIYLVDKNQKTGASKLYRASSHDKTINWEKADTRLAYHLDRLGGKPHIEDLSLENENSED